MDNKDKNALPVIIFFMLVGSVGGFLGLFFGFLMSFFIGGQASSERYITGFNSRFWPLDIEFVYFAIGITIFMTVAVLFCLRLIERIEKR